MTNKTLLNLQDKMAYPPDFAKALAKSDEAAKLMGSDGSPLSLGECRQAIRLLAESNRLLVQLLTDGNVR